MSNSIKHSKKQTLMQWIWKSFLKTAMFPLILVEIAFIGIYFLTSDWSKNEMFSMLKNNVQDELPQFVIQESEAIQSKLSSISNMTELFRQQVKVALHDPNFKADETDLNRLSYSNEGVYYSTKNHPDDGAAIFYSGFKQVKDVERQKVNKLLATQQLMKNIQQSEPLAAAIYFNTHDSLNIIYPYFNVLEQYPPFMDIPSYNFYYEADLNHNPTKDVVWTDAYLDPAGNGWMASAIAPVYNENFLEGVVGMDITIETITKEILNLQIPWNGYGVLVGKDGTILALPEQGENTWGLTELKGHSYSDVIYQDTFKPEEFNIYNRPELSILAEMVKQKNNGLMTVKLNNHNQLVSWSTIPETDWKLFVVVQEENIYTHVNDVSKQLLELGTLIIITFYVLFFIILYCNSKVLSSNISKPLFKINEMVSKIGQGDFYQDVPSFKVKELENTANELAIMGANLGNATNKLTQAQIELQKRGEDLQALVLSIDDVIIKLDSNGTNLNGWTNDSNYLLSEMLTGKTVLDIFGEEKGNQILSIIQTVIKTMKPEIFEYSINTPTGEKWFQGRISPIVDKDGKNDLVSFTSRDITIRKNMEKSLIRAKEEAEKANVAKSEFLSSMSHELRTPMNAILGFAQLLEYDDSEPLSNSQKESVGEILKAGNHLLTLINEVLDLAKIESGKLSISIEPVEVRSVINEVLSLCYPLAQKRGISIEKNVDSCLEDYINVDRTRIKQVLLNLMSNAVKYNKENGNIILACKKTNQKVRFMITDTGEGIDESDYQNIFEPFKRLSENYTVEGTGIGLTVSKQLIELMSGAIGVNSKKGVGSTFWIEVPLLVNFESNLTNINEIVESDELYINNETKRVILYIEDNPANLNLVQRILAKETDIELFSAANGELGLELAQAHEPDLILLDINLPGIDGFEVFKRLKTKEETKNIPVIAISANAMPRDVEKGLALGFTNYLTKPIDVKEFKKAIQNIFNIL